MVYSFVESWKVGKAPCRLCFRLERAMREEMGLRESMWILWRPLVKASQTESRNDFRPAGSEHRNWIDEDALEIFPVLEACSMPLAKACFGREIRFLDQQPPVARSLSFCLTMGPRRQWLALALSTLFDVPSQPFVQASFVVVQLPSYAFFLYAFDPSP